jgi:tetratricopeptide (TPR) repeat protein
MSDALEEAVERLRDGDAEGALADLRVLATREPLNADVHFQIGQCLAALGQFGPATVAYKMALRQAPTFLGAWVQLGLLGLEVAMLVVLLVHLGDLANKAVERRRAQQQTLADDHEDDHDGGGGSAGSSGLGERSAGGRGSHSCLNSKHMI